MFTFRSYKTQKEYDRFKKSPQDTSFDLSRSIANYEHWAIIPNDFPYDIIARRHDLLIPKRKIISFWEMTDEELLELRTIKEHLDDRYTSIIENFTNMRSIRDHLHLHLIDWREDFFSRSFSVDEILSIVQKNSNENPRNLTTDFYIRGLIEEINEVEQEIKTGDKKRLESELADVLWDYLNLLSILEKQGLISDSQSVFSGAAKKYQERLPAMLNGSQTEWDIIKEKQKKELRK